MNTLKKIACLAVLSSLLLSCDGFGNNESEETTKPVDTVVGNVEPQDSVITVEGVAVDGSKRNPILEVEGTDEPVSIELPYEVDVTWEVGDTITVKYIHTDSGDSVIDATSKPAK